MRGSIILKRALYPILDNAQVRAMRKVIAVETRIIQRPIELNY
jgi:hypothetical protein